MGRPLGYLIEGEGIGKLYPSLFRAEKGDYSVVAEAIESVICSDDFRKGAARETLLSETGRLLKAMKKDLTDEDIRCFKRFYGIGQAGRDTMADMAATPLAEKNIRYTIELMVRRLRDGKEQAKPAEYRSEIWKHVYGKMKNR